MNALVRKHKLVIVAGMAAFEKKSTVQLLRYRKKLHELQVPEKIDYNAGIDLGKNITMAAQKRQRVSRTK
jgi:hypothetical protein